MNIAVASDHGGFLLKTSLVTYLQSLGHSVHDFGCFNTDSMDYPDVAYPASEAVARGEYKRGILVCSTGIGMSISANKVRGIRCALCCNTHMAEMTRRHNDTNVLALGAQEVDEALAKQIVSIWLDTGFEGGRHEGRIKKISDYETHI